MKPELTYGLHSVQSLLKSAPTKIESLILLDSRHDQRLKKIHHLAERAGVTIILSKREAMDALCDGNHQGVIANVTGGDLFGEKDLYAQIEASPQTSLILILDGVTDPHNLGACMRSADAAGVTAVIVPKDNSVGLTEVARKVACGAAENIPLIVVTNLSRCMDKLQALGVWVTGTAGEATLNHFDSDLSLPRVIVMGAEGKGMRRLTRDYCDTLVRIPMAGSVSSLNVSVAAGVLLFEAVRQQHVLETTID
ncbi:MAG: 23S rRNA (guanosine2251-2'-O)-methyltransferase [Flavobacteriales bacterium]